MITSNPLGYSFIELLIALTLISLTLTGLASFALYAAHNLVAINQSLCAAQILTNISEELLSSENTWTAARLTYWQNQAKEQLPSALLDIHPPRLEITWLSDTPLSMHCSKKDQARSCLGFGFS